jgi:hypothetical protein
LTEESRSEATLFAVGGDGYGWDDVVALAKLRGDWHELAEQVHAGRAALAELHARSEPLPEEEIEVAARRFRYARDLLAADELADWLDKHRLTAEDWQGYLSRELARELVPDAAGGVSRGELETAVWAEGICSGRLEALAYELARMAAVSPGAALERLEPAYDAFCAQAVDDDAESREIEANRLEWLRLRYAAVVADTEGAAHELVLCVRADGDSLGAAAERAGLGLLEDDCWLDELEPAIATRFLAAKPGELVGPVAVEDGFLVAHVIEKTAPSLEDAAVRARAHDAALTRAVTRLVADRVVWR